VGSVSTCPSLIYSELVLCPEQHRSTPSAHRFLSELFSSTYKSLFPQLHCLHIHTKPPGVPPSHFDFNVFNSPNVQRASDPRKSFNCRIYAKSVCKSFSRRFYEKT